MSEHDASPVDGNDAVETDAVETAPLEADLLETGTPFLEGIDPEEAGADVIEEIEKTVLDNIVPTYIPETLRAQSSSAANELEEYMTDVIDDEDVCRTCATSDNVTLRENPLTLGQETPDLEPMCADCEAELLRQI